MKVEFRRNLPHIYMKDAIYNIVFRLNGSLPKNVLSDYIREKEILKKKHKQNLIPKLYNDHIDSFLNENRELNYLLQSDILGLVIESMHYFEKKRYDIICYCIMPNHVHLLINTMNYKFIELGSTLGSIKKFSGRIANSMLGRDGHFWQIENFDHIVRSRNELAATIKYNIHNPVKVGFVKDWKDWEGTYVDERYLDEEYLSSTLEF